MMEKENKKINLSRNLFISDSVYDTARETYVEFGLY